MAILDITPLELEKMFSPHYFGARVERVERITGLDFQGLPEYEAAEKAMADFYRAAISHYHSNLNEIASEWYSRFGRSEVANIK